MSGPVNDTRKLRLELEVDVDLNAEDLVNPDNEPMHFDSKEAEAAYEQRVQDAIRRLEAELQENLQSIARYAMSEGLVTGNTPMEVETWQARVVLLEKDHR